MWDPQREITLRVIETNFPLCTSDIRTVLEADGNATIVTIDTRYALKYGALGRALDALFVRREYRRGLEASLAGLKSHAERFARPPFTSPGTGTRREMTDWRSHRS